MRIIDAHAHIGNDPNGKETPVVLAALMRRAGISQAAVFAAAVNDLSTEHLLKAITPYRDVFFAIGTVSPDKPAFRPPLAKIERWLKDGEIRGLKFYTGYEHFYPADRRLRPYMRLLAKYGRPAIFHMGDTWDAIGGAKLKYAHPLNVDDLATEMPDLKIIIAHLGSPWIIDTAQVCYKNKNVYTDCSGFVYGSFNARQKAYFRELWRKFDIITESSGKILFGTDWPISEQKSYIEVVKELAGKHRERVFHGNAEALFGLKP